MLRKPREVVHRGLMTLVVGAMVSLVGCGSSNPQLADYVPPKDQIEGLNRLKEGNAKHDETAPANQKSYASPTYQRAYSRWR